MKIFAILPLLAATISFTVGFYDFLSWLQRKKEPYSLAFVAICFCIALFGLACAVEYNSEDPAVVVLCLRLESILLNLSGMAFMWLVSQQTRLVTRFWMALFLVLCGLGVAVQLIGFGALTWDVDSVFRVNLELPFGGRASFLEVKAGPLSIAQGLFGMVLLAYNAVIVVRHWRRHRDIMATSLVVSLAIIGLSYLNDFLVDQEVYSFVYLVEYSWLAAVVIMGVQRGQALVEAGRMRRALSESEGRYQAIFESLQDVYFRTDGQGMLMLLSPSLMTVFGYHSHQLTGRLAWRFLPDPAFRREVFGAIRRQGRIVDLELALVGPDERRFEVSVSAQVNFSENTRIVEGMIRDIAERKQNSLALRAALKEKDVLMDEIHHRVKNNLQVIYSLLKLQLFKLEDPFSRSVLQECRNQVLAMALIHDELYRSRDIHEIDFGEYLKTLANRLISSFGMADTVHLVPVIEPINLGIAKAIPCGLIVNELCTNVLKYAFPAGYAAESRELWIRMMHWPRDMVRLEIADNGVGLPAGFDLASTKTLGLKIINQLCRQLDARLETSVPAGGGTCFSLVFPLAEISRE